MFASRRQVGQGLCSYKNLPSKFWFSLSSSSGRSIQFRADLSCFYFDTRPFLIDKLGRGHETVRNSLRSLDEALFHLQDDLQYGAIDKVKIGDLVELLDGDYLKVCRIVRQPAEPLPTSSRFHGWRFRLVNRTIGLSRKYHNEVYLVLNSTEAQKTEATGIQKLDRYELWRKSGLKMRLLLASCGVNHDTQHSDGSLFCRWKHSFNTKSSYLGRFKLQKLQKPPTSAFQPPAADIEHACFEPLSTQDIACITANKESLDSSPNEACPINHMKSHPPQALGNDSEPVSLKDGSRGLHLEKCPHTFGDLFCGCGGASLGAQKAGLSIRFGIDSDPNACESFDLNFPGKMIEMDAHHIKDLNKDHMKVDILHISTPCQYVSSAHTTRGVNDQLNIDAIQAIGPALDKSQPRVVTLENTPGLMQLTRGTGGNISVRQCFDDTLRQFTSHGFSVSWRIVQMAEYGVDQNRARLILIASR